MSGGDAPVSARRLASGAGWTYGSQIAAVAAQFGYAAITSRLVGPGEFGVYAITLSITSLITLIATGGLGQTVGRLDELDAMRIRSLFTVALVLGLASAAALGLLAPVWAALWSTPEASKAVATMSISAIFAPFYGLLTGLVRRLGRFRLLAGQQLAGNVLGMAAGAVIVVFSRSTVSLLAAPIISQALVTLFCAWTSRRYLGLGTLKGARSEVSFSAQLTAVSLLSYGVGNATRIVATSALGAAAMGYWNRAEVVSSVPMQQAQNALIQTIYPEFRHDRRSSARAKRVWTDLMVLVSWLIMIVAMLGAVVVPPLVLVLLGPQWSVAQTLVPVLMFAGAAQTVGTLLGSAVEAIGRFRWVWSTQIFLLLLQALLAGSIVLTRSLLVAVAGLLITSVARQVWQVALCSRHGYLDGRRVARQSAITTLVCAGLCALLTLLLHLIGGTVLNTVLIVVSLAVLTVLLRRPLLRSEPGRLLIEYGLVPGRLVTR